MKQKRLSELEEVIHKNRRNFYHIGKSLMEIRDEGLYRFLLYKTFESYTRERWEIGKSQAYRLIESCRVIDNLSPIGDILPENESQVRQLAPLGTALQRQIWRDFLKTGLTLTAPNIRKFISAGKTGSNNTGAELTERISAAYKAAAIEMLEKIREAQSEGWQSTSREACLFWNRVMKDKILSDHSGKI